MQCETCKQTIYAASKAVTLQPAWEVSMNQVLPRVPTRKIVLLQRQKVHQLLPISFLSGAMSQCFYIFWCNAVEILSKSLWGILFVCTSKKKIDLFLFHLSKYNLSLYAF
jgi:hypothetical protein